MKLIAALIMTLCMLWHVCGNEPDILIADFESPDYGAWQVTGDAFGKGPAHGALPSQQQVSGFIGKGLVNSYFNGDRSQGTLTSPEFKIERRYINFLIGGGNHPDQTCINLIVDSKAVRTATGQDNEQLDWNTWDVTEFNGKSARIEIVDKHSGGWGHINVDEIFQSNERKQEPEDTTPPALYDEKYRPQFHFSAKKNWLNDPNGLVYYKGEYHLFFQHNPTGNEWGNMTWGHAVSKDLVHWEQLEHALLPDKLGTMFSGSAVVDWNNSAGFQIGGEKTLIAIYTAAGGTSPESKPQPFTQCLAYSTDAGRTFTKLEKPILAHVAGGNRDPKIVWFEPGKKWIMALYLDKNDYGFFSSTDLKNWTHLQNITVPGCSECPDFFEIPVDGDRNNRKWVWTAANGQYLVGTFDGEKFQYEGRPRSEDWGNNYYAVQSYSDIPAEDGRRIQIAWMNGGRYPKMPFNQQMSFPCELKLRNVAGELRLCRTPVAEIETIHAKEHNIATSALKPGENPLAGISGELFDIKAEFESGDASTVGIKVRGEVITWSVKENKLSCLGKSVVLPQKSSKISLRILVDRSSLEVYANDGEVSMTSCFLPRSANRSLEAFATDGNARIVSLKVFELNSAWKK